MKTLQNTKRKYLSDHNFQIIIDDLMKALQQFNMTFHAAGLFPIDLTVVTSVSIGFSFELLIAFGVPFSILSVLSLPRAKR